MIDVGTPLSLDVSGPLAGLQKIADADNELRQQQLKTNQAIGTSFASVASSVGQYGAQLSSVIVETQRGAAAQQQFAREISGLVKEIRDQAAATREQQRALAESAAERRKASAAAREASRAEKQAAKEVAAAEKEAAAAAKMAAKASADAAREAEKSGNFFTNLFRKITGAPAGGNVFSGVLNSAVAATAGLFALNEISSRVKQGLADYGAIKGVQTTLTAVAGSAADGGREFAYIKQKSDELGLSLIPTAKAYTGLFAAAKEANLSVATTRSVFEGVAGAAKVLSLSADDTNGVLLALQQIASKGTVQAEELRGQIGERLPGAFGLAAKAMGLTTAELNKQLQAGKVLASDFLPKFAAQLKATYGDATADAATQVGSNLGRINTFLSESSAKIGAFVAPAIAALANLVSASKTAQQVSDSLASAYVKQNDGLRELQQTTTPLLARYEELNSVANRNTGQQRELDAVIQQLAKTVPSAVTQFDAYGKALGINSEAVRAFVRDQEKLTELNNADKLKQNSQALRQLLAEQQRIARELNNTETDPKTGLKLRREEYKVGQGQAVPSLLSAAESNEITNRLTAQLAKIQEDVRINLLNRQVLRGKSPLLPADPTPTQIQGLVEKQQNIIKDLQERQKKAALENKGNGADYLLGAGGLDEALDLAQKELQRLLGKIDKAASAAESRLKAALAALATAQENLRTKAAAAAIKDSQDEAERARLVFGEALKQTEKLKQAIIAREKAVAEAALKAGGQKRVEKLGDKADGQTSAGQDAELGKLNVAALDAYYRQLLTITLKREQQVFDLRRESDSKELEAINRRYDAERAKLASFQSAEFDAIDEAAGIKLDKARILTANEIALEEARQRELLAARQRQRQRQIEQERDAANATAANAGQLFGAGTGISKPDAELMEQRARLENERKFLQASLENTKSKAGKEAEIERERLRSQLAAVDNQIKELNTKAAFSKFSLAKLILGDEDDGEGGPKRQKIEEYINTITSSVISAFDSVARAQEQAADAQIAARDRNISVLQSQIALEVQRNAEGSASNLAGLQKELKEEQAARKEALQAKRAAQKQEAAIAQAQQAVALATAAANILVGYSGLPIIGQVLGAIAIAAMLASFVATKSAASDAAYSGDYFTGGFTPEGGKYEVAGTVHKGEFVANQELTKDYRSLFKNLHEGTPERINWELPAMQRLLPEMPDLTSLLPDFSLPGRMREERQQYSQMQQSANFGPVLDKLAAVQAELAEIKSSNQRMADQPTETALGDGRVITKTSNGSTKLTDYGSRP